MFCVSSWAISRIFFCFLEIPRYLYTPAPQEIAEHSLFFPFRAVQNAAGRTQTLVVKSKSDFIKRQNFRWRLVPLVDLFMHVEIYKKSVPSVGLFFCGAGKFCSDYE